jgi:CRISPR system Cascade subunit CasA
MGRNLHETLLLNLAPYDAASGTACHLPGGYSDQPDLPAWERSVPGPVGPVVRAPDGYLDLLTWPSRRIKLFPQHEDGRTVVRRAAVFGGDQIPDAWEISLREPGGAWELTRDESGYRALNVDPERATWRGLHALITHESARSAAPASERVRAPAVLTGWLATLSRHGALPDGYVPQVQVIGVRYNQHRSVIIFSHGDTLPLPLSLLAADQMAAYETALEAVARAERAGAAVAEYGRRLQRAVLGTVREKRGTPADIAVRAAAARAGRLFWPRLDDGFRLLLNALAAADDETCVRELREFTETVRRCALDTASVLSLQAGPAVLRSRVDDQREHVPNAAEAENRFLMNLTAALGQRPRTVSPGFDEE